MTRTALFGVIALIAISAIIFAVNRPEPTPC